MTRLPDWETRLNNYVVECGGRPFVWGEFDCAMFAAGAVIAMTGDDPLAEFRGRYSTGPGSIRALKRYGAGTLEATFDTKFAACPISFARRGDLAFHEGSLGVVMGPFALFVGAVGDVDGLIRFPRASWERAWTVA